MSKANAKQYYESWVKCGSARTAAEKEGCHHLTIQKWGRRYAQENNLPVPKAPSSTWVPPEQIQFPDKKKLTSNVKHYIITCAQNNTPLEEGAWACLKAAAKHMKAELCVIPLLYKNPTGYSRLEAAEIEWPKEILPHSIHSDIVINDQWMILGGLHIQTTAAQPLSGLAGITASRSGVVGHPQIELKARPVPPGSPPIMHVTTGSISQPIYSDTKAGQLAHFHHSAGALLLETDGVDTFVRHLRYDHDTKTIIDIDTKFHASGKIETGDYIDGAVFGDLHEQFSPHTDFILDFCRQYSPKHIFLHDAFDSFSISHHHKGNPFLTMAKQRTGHDDFMAEVLSLVGFHNNLTAAAPRSQIVYVDSNHCDQHIFRWLKENDWRIMGSDNASAYLKLAATYVGFIKDPALAMTMVTRGKMPSPLNLLLEERGADLSSTTVLHKDEMMRLHDIEHGFHGHQGPNGSRGTVGGFVRTQVKINRGHSHSPDITKNVYTAGTSGPLQAEYTAGPSSWGRAHILVYSNGTRVMFTCSDNKFRI